MPHHAILFDLDQTLLNRHDSLIQFCDWQATQQFGFDPVTTQRYINRFVALDADGAVWKDQVYAQLKPEFGITDSVQDLVASYLNDFQNFCIPFPKVPETIQQLHAQGYRLGLISNGRTPFQQQNFHSLGLNGYFSSIVVSAAVGLRKPDPAIFLFACQQLELAPEQCIFIGDNERADIQGAQSVGMTAIRFDPPQSVLSATASCASARFNDFSNLIPIIQAL